MNQITFSDHWRRIQRNNFIHWEELFTFLQLNEYQIEQIAKHPSFSLNLPLRLADKIEKKTLEDPILKQFLPTKSEEIVSDGFKEDPVEDRNFQFAPKLLHKYHGRVLLVTTSACAMHCRYCFRQNFTYQTDDPSFEKELDVIKNDESIHEVILSGGDPLSFSNQRLESLLGSLSTIPHLRRIRIHTRFPIGIPERIDAPLLRMLENLPQQVWFIIHCNHPNEIDAEILSRVKSIQKLGIPVLNQAVLLRGVNDEVDVLSELCETLSDNGIIPYYLHQLDRVQGAAHFEVSRERGLRLIEALQCRLPGYAVPKYVEEISGEASKTAMS